MTEIVNAPDHIWATFDIDVSADVCDVYAQYGPDGFVGEPVKYTRNDKHILVLDENERLRLYIVQLECAIKKLEGK